MYLLVLMALASLAQIPSGEQWNKKSVLTAEQPVEFPGIVLKPGNYVIRVLEGGDKRSTIQILNGDETQVLAKALAVPDHRMRPDSGEFSYHAVPASGPRAIQSWFYPGDLTGLEFVYPKARARELAKASGVYVMAAGSDDGPVTAVTPNGKEIVIDEGTQSARRKPQ